MCIEHLLHVFLVGVPEYFEGYVPNFDHRFQVLDLPCPTFREMEHAYPVNTHTH